MIRRWPDVSDVIPANEHTNYGFHVNSENFWSVQFCFVKKEDQFKQKLLI